MKSNCQITVGKEYRTPSAKVIVINVESLICVSAGGSEDGDIGEEIG